MPQQNQGVVQTLMMLGYTKLSDTWYLVDNLDVIDNQPGNRSRVPAPAPVKTRLLSSDEVVDAPFKQINDESKS